MDASRTSASDPHPEVSEALEELEGCKKRKKIKIETKRGRDDVRRNQRYTTFKSRERV
jgi:hypothetical protein